MSLLLNRAVQAAEAGIGQREFIDPRVLRTNGGTQMRAMLYPTTVDSYAEIMLDADGWGDFPPPIAFYDGEDYWIGDGFHRVAAYLQAGFRDSILVEVRRGTRRDAVLFAAGANGTHGLPRTRADKRRAVETLLRDEEWGQWSDREIARRCHVSNRFVSDLRREIVTVYNTQSDERMYTTRHGTQATMNVSGQRAAAQARNEMVILPDDLARTGNCQIEKTPNGRYVAYYTDPVTGGQRRQRTVTLEDAFYWLRGLLQLPDGINIIACPQCGAEQEDHDGFGVVYCEACGYCTHPSLTGNICDLCQATIPRQPSNFVAPAIRHLTVTEVEAVIYRVMQTHPNGNSSQEARLNWLLDHHRSADYLEALSPGVVLSSQAFDVAYGRIKRQLEATARPAPSSNPRLIEALAAHVHDEAWAGWMSYLFNKCTLNDDGTVTIPADLVARWQYQVSTPYAQLPNEMKRGDREQAERILTIIAKMQ